MAMYLIGDVQGCDAPLQRMLDALAFSPSRDTLYLLGDLVNRGPDSDKVLRRLMSYGSSAQCLLGNHDLHLLAVAHGVRKTHRKDTLDCILRAPDSATLLGWLQQQHLALELVTPHARWLMVHAGVLPAWSADQTLALAAEVQAQLRGPQALAFFHTMYGNQPDRWQDDLQGADRLRVVVNALTRLRFCSADGAMEFESKEGAGSAPPGFMPWFDVPGRKTKNCTLAFGHWSTLGWLARDDVIALDSGCVWGGCLTALEVDTGHHARQPRRHEVHCEQFQTPG
ncbi:MAG: bis(5'-nucleosyl)-tetraphosphatase (symmetrical) [Burkholderiales bacterium PBB4]|nr:MAG: bis(5'-nucleosyl)-tetraphosphatase (symmetrical) [Burkholderiales bacterium PBB4]